MIYNKRTHRFPFSISQSPATDDRRIYERIESIEQAPEPGDATTGRRYKAVMMTGEIITDFHTGRTRYAHQLDRNGTIHLDRMNSGRAPIVDNHAMWGTGGENVLGVVEKGSVSMQAEGLVGTIRFQPDDQLPAGIRNGLSSGVLQNLSIQVSVLGMERIESDGLVLAKVTEYDPFEVSVVPVGADSGAHFMRIAQSMHGFGPLHDHTDGGGAATPPAGATTTVAAAAEATDTTPTPDEIRVAERARVTGIQSICQPIGLDPQPFIDGGQSVDDVRQAIQQRFTGAGELFRPIDTSPQGAVVQQRAGSTDLRSFLVGPTDEGTVRQAERDRISAIREICQSPLASDADPEPFIVSGQSADQVRADLWNRSNGGERQTPDASTGDTTAFSQASTPRGGSREERMITGIQHSFLERGDPDNVVSRHEKLTIDSGEYRGISLCDAGRLLMGHAGREIGFGREAVAQSILRHSEAVRQAIGIPGSIEGNVNGGQILGAQGSIRQAFGGIGGTPIGAQGQSDLSVVIENLMHRTMSAAFAMQGEVSAWRLCCKIVMANDFRLQNHIFLGALPDMGTREDTGDFPRAQIPNPEKATTQVTERGQTIVVSRTVLINDDLGIVFQTPRLQGVGAQRLINHMFFQKLAENSGLGPNVGVTGVSQSLFHANHSNVGNGVALSAAAVRADRTLMAKQLMVGSAAAKDQSAGGFDLYGDFRLDVYLVPIDLEDTLMIIRDSEKEPGTDNQNTQRGTFKTIVGSPLLSGTRRYAFSTGAMGGGVNQSPICVSFFGQQAPYMFMAEISIGRGMVWHAAIDVGVDAVNYRGAITDAGV